MSEKICFFVTPIGKEESPERKQSNIVLNHFIRPVCKSLGFNVVRVDELNTVDNIDSTIINYLKTAELVIADMSGHNPNVFYEFGYRQALNLPLVPMILEGSKIPFDVSTLRTISYVTNDLDKVNTIKKRLHETIQSFNFDNLKKPVSDSHHFDNTTLLSMQDKLDRIIELTEQRNNDEIDKISAQVAKYAQPQISDEAILMKALLPQILNNPKSINTLVDLSNQFQNHNN